MPAYFGRFGRGWSFRTLTTRAETTATYARFGYLSNIASVTGSVADSSLTPTWAKATLPLGSIPSSTDVSRPGSSCDTLPGVFFERGFSEALRVAMNSSPQEFLIVPAEWRAHRKSISP